ncbi:MAG: N-acetyltransferase [Desulfobacteraceae bacterium]|nr:MAG: N-acetyltransferase [Desulfobacteraceae bacterium]
MNYPDRISKMNIATEHLWIKSLEPNDVEALTMLWTDPEVTRFMGGPRDYESLKKDIMQEALSGKQTTQDDLWPTVEKKSNRVIGHCGLLNKEVDGVPEVELIYVLAKESWGKGYAVEAGRALRDYAFNELGLQRLIALIDPENRASAKVALKIGMIKEKETLRPNARLMQVYQIRP